MLKRFLATIVIVSLMSGTAPTTQGQAAGQTQGTTADQQAMDKLLAPIALYPDSLLAQVLACASSPQQVGEVSQWLQKNSQLQGSELQAAAETAGFDASFIAIVLFPDVLKFMEQNMAWTTEIGKAFVSDQKTVLDSVQRLRAQAKAVGNLKTTPQQEVKTETQSGTQVIVIQPANPQVVYVPVYNPQTVYVAPPPPPPDNSDKVAAAAIIGFGLGIALGAAMADDHYGYYGWGAWGMGWHTHTVVVAGGAWRVPPRARYPYARPVPAYRPNVNVNAPTYNNVNINVDRDVNNLNNSNNVNRPTANTNAATRTARPTTAPAQNTRPATQPTAPTARPTTGASSATLNQGAARPATQQTSRAASASAGASPYNSSRGRPPATSSAGAATKMESGSRAGAFSGYSSGASQRAASTRGSASARSAQGGGGRRAR